MKPQTTLRILLVEKGGAESLAPAERFATVCALLEHGYAVTCAASEGPVAPLGGHPILILGRFLEGLAGQQALDSGEGLPAIPLTATGEQGRVDGGQSPGWVSRPAVCTSGDQPLYFRDLRGIPLADVPGLVEAVRLECQAVHPGDWQPWFPVIDYDRCTNCLQCLSFCLFSVYGVDAQHRITVETSENCKTNCPACSRVCPEAAIVFPKYKAGPINGDAISEADLRREKMKVDISALLGGDIYQMLRDRSERARSRFSHERDADKALEERRRCLAALAAAADIPPEVLRALPSPEEIRRRAEEAKARVLAAQRPSSVSGSAPSRP